MEFLGQIKLTLYAIMFVLFFGVCSPAFEASLENTDMLKKQNHLILNVKTINLNSEGFLLNCNLKNTGNKDIDFFIAPYLNVELHIFINGSEEPLKMRVLYRSRISKNEVYKVYGNEAHSFELEITKTDFLWPKPGLYNARVVYKNTLKKIEGIEVWTGQVESNTFQLEFR